MNQNNEEIRFIPYEEEMTPNLKQLMLSISTQIDEYCVKTSASPSLINRFVAGHICCEDSTHLAVQFGTPKKSSTRSPSSWNKFNSIKGGQSCGRYKFSGSSKLSEEWSAMTQEEKEEYKKMDIIPKKRKTHIIDTGESLKHIRYAKALYFLEKYLNSMKENFETHVIMITATDTRQNMLYSPSVYANSGKECVSIHLKSN